MKQLYKPSRMKLTSDQNIQLTRLFNILYHEIPSDSDMIVYLYLFRI